MAARLTDGGAAVGQPRARQGTWLVLGASLAFATSSPLSRLARPAHPFLIACARVLLAAMVLMALDLPGVVRSARGLSPAHRLRVVLAGLLLAGHFALFQWGLDETSLAAAVSLVSLEPLSVVLFAWLFFGIVPKPLERAGVAVATVGAVLVARGSGSGEHKLLGDLLVLGAVVLFGLYVASARGLKDALPAMHYAPLVYAAAAIALAFTLPFAPPSPTATLWPLPVGSWVAVVALALIPTVVGHTLVQVGARTLSPSLLALVCPGETLGSILLSVLLWSKAPMLEEALGGVIILSGALLAIRAQRHVPPPRPESSSP